MPTERPHQWRSGQGSAVPGAGSLHSQEFERAMDRLVEARAHGEFIAVRDQAVRRGILAVGVVLTLPLLAATLCAAGARYFWLFDLAVHFRVQYAVMGL